MFERNQGPIRFTNPHLFYLEQGHSGVGSVLYVWEPESQDEGTWIALGTMAIVRQ